jgi:hypothetical protein
MCLHVQQAKSKRLPPDFPVRPVDYRFLVVVARVQRCGCNLHAAVKAKVVVLLQKLGLPWQMQALGWKLPDPKPTPHGPSVTPSAQVSPIGARQMLSSDSI